MQSVVSSKMDKETGFIYVEDDKERKGKERKAFKTKEQERVERENRGIEIG